MSVLDGYRFDRTLDALSELRALLRCSSCAGPPGRRPVRLGGCGHTVCLTCYGPAKEGDESNDDDDEFWPGGVCPVSGCGVASPAAEGPLDRECRDRWDAVEKVAAALRGDDKIRRGRRRDDESDKKFSLEHHQQQQGWIVQDVDMDDISQLQKQRQVFLIESADRLTINWGHESRWTAQALPFKTSHTPFSRSSGSDPDDCQKSGDQGAAKFAKEPPRDPDVRPDQIESGSSSSPEKGEKTKFSPRRGRKSATPRKIIPIPAEIVRAKERRQAKQAEEEQEVEMEEDPKMDEAPKVSPAKRRLSRTLSSSPTPSDMSLGSKKSLEQASERRKNGKPPKKRKQKKKRKNSETIATTPPSTLGVSGGGFSPGGITSNNVNRKNAKGETPLHLACIKGNVAAVRDLLLRGANPGPRDHAGWTPLHEASQRGFIEIVEVLLDTKKKGGVIDACAPAGPENLTPLHDAAMGGHVDVVRLLITKGGANKGAVNSEGRTPREVAMNPATVRAIDTAECAETSKSSEGDSASKKSNKIVVYFAQNLPAEKASEVRQLARSQHGAKVEARLSPEVTTVVFAKGKKGKTLDVETLTSGALADFYEAAVTGKWIFGIEWLNDSLKEGQFISEDPSSYQMLSPLGHALNTPAARADAFRRMPPLLDGCHIFLRGVYTNPYPSRQDWSRVIKAAGGRVLTREPDPEGDDCKPGPVKKIPYHADKEGPLAICTHYIVYQEGSKKEPLLKYNMAHIKTLPAAWLARCLVEYKLQLWQ